MPKKFVEIAESKTQKAISWFFLILRNESHKSEYCAGVTSRRSQRRRAANNGTGHNLLPQCTWCYAKLFQFSALVLSNSNYVCTTNRFIHKALAMNFPWHSLGGEKINLQKFFRHCENRWIYYIYIILIWLSQV